MYGRPPSTGAAVRRREAAASLAVPMPAAPLGAMQPRAEITLPGHIVAKLMRSADWRDPGVRARACLEALEDVGAFMSGPEAELLGTVRTMFREVVMAQPEVVDQVCGTTVADAAVANEGDDDDSDDDDDDDETPEEKRAKAIAAAAAADGANSKSYAELVAILHKQVGELSGEVESLAADIAERRERRSRRIEMHDELAEANRQKDVACIVSGRKQEQMRAEVEHMATSYSRRERDVKSAVDEYTRLLKNRIAGYEHVRELEATERAEHGGEGGSGDDNSDAGSDGADANHGAPAPPTDAQRAATEALAALHAVPTRKLTPEEVAARERAQIAATAAAASRAPSRCASRGSPRSTAALQRSAVMSDIAVEQVKLELRLQAQAATAERLAPADAVRLRREVDVKTFEARDQETALERLHTTVAETRRERNALTIQVSILEDAVTMMKFMVEEAVDTLNADELAKYEQTRGGISRSPSMQDSSDDEGASGPHQPLLPFIGLGTGPSVPPFLRTDDPVRNFAMTKRHTELLIKKLWALKIIYDDAAETLGQARSTLAGFLDVYLQRRFTSRQQQLELSYNFVNAMTQHRYDGDVDLFYKILFEGVSEQHYYDQMAMIAHLKHTLVQMDLCDNVRDGRIHPAVFFPGLRQFFPIKSEASMRRLVDTVMREGMTDGQVDTRKLLLETTDGDQSEFMEAVREQYLEEVFEFPREIERLLVKAARAHAEKQQSSLGGLAVSRALAAANASAAAAHRVGASEGPASARKTKAGVATAAADAEAAAQRQRATQRGEALDLGPRDDDECPFGEIVAVLHGADPNKTPAQIRELMARGCVLPPDSLVQQEAVDKLAARRVRVKPFLAHLRSTFLHRTGHYVPTLDMGALAALIPEGDRVPRAAANTAAAAAVKAAAMDGGASWCVDGRPYPPTPTVEEAVRRLEDYK